MAQRFICLVIDQANVGPYRDQAKVKAMLSDRLKGHGTLENWLEVEHGIICYSPWQTKYVDKMLITRHAWIDSMIAEFQAKGD